MLRAELLEVIASGESSGVEFKRDDVRPEQVAKEVVAMANLKGGRVLLGVEDDGTVSGLQRANVEEWVMDAVFGAKVHPLILPFYEEVGVDDGKRVAVISFTEGTTKPYVLRHQGREDIYIRVGSTSRLASREQQARLFAAGGLLHMELLPVSGAGFAALDVRRLADYLTHALREPQLPETEQEWERRLRALGFMTAGVGSGSVCTIAGLVLFGNTPRRTLRQAGLRCQVFDSTDKSYDARLDRVLDGPLVGLWSRAREGAREFVGEGLIEAFAEAIRPFVSREAPVLGNGVRREAAWSYPQEAIREAVANALAHRDWTRSTEIEVTVYADRMEIVSPGALPNTMSVEKMVAGQRSPRNPIITDVLRDYGYVDARGMGVRRKIIPLMREQNGVEAVFEATDDYLKVVLPARRPVA